MNRAALPAIDRLLRAAPELPRAVATPEARQLVAEVRAGSPPPADWAAELRARVARRLQPRLRRVINATGIVLHTNLGRAPMAPEAAEAVHRAATGYANLEFDLSSGQRGERIDLIAPLLTELCGAEAALAVNNNAAAVLLALSALAAGKEVVVSRGELVEIGGSFRIPEVIAQGGARLVEVGATNRTRLSDYQNATTPATAAWLVVHRSNFHMSGFVSSPDRHALATAAHQAGVLLLEDLGSGALTPNLGEPTLRDVLSAGVDLACASGDKLLGGPQAGIIVGRAEPVARLRRHPLYRALRLDRLVLAALEATLQLYQRGDAPPAVHLLLTPPSTLQARALRWAQHLHSHNIPATVLPDHGAAGAGSLPGEQLLTFTLQVASPPPDILVRLRNQAVPIVARLEGGTLRIDPRTVFPSEEEDLLAGLILGLGGS